MLLPRSVAVEPTKRWTRPNPVEMATINVMGNDAPGIVKAITSAVAEQSIDILTVESEVLSAPFSGAEMFQLQMVGFSHADQPRCFIH